MEYGAELYFTDVSLDALLAWYHANGRILPWRQTQDPYHIWLSEIMLQQTRVEAVKPYYARFLAVCPTIEALARLPEERLMKLWEGLGYYSRARNLQKAARRMCEEYGGSLPASYEELRRLPGIGDYTAGAIASIAFGQRVPAVDGNVLRVMARLAGSYEDITAPSVKKDYREALGRVVPADAASFTQAMIELGATLCGPNTAPRCEECPMASVCETAKRGLWDEIPVRSAKKPRRIEQRTVLLIRDERRTALRKRPERGLLSGLYELPNVEGHLGEDEVLSYIRSVGFEPLRIERLEDAKHIFSHVEWHMIAYAVRITPEFDDACGAAGAFLVENEILHAEYAIPSAFSAYTKYL